MYVYPFKSIVLIQTISTTMHSLIRDNCHAIKLTYLLDLYHI